MKRAWIFVVAAALATAIGCSSAGTTTVESLGASDTSDTAGATEPADPSGSDTTVVTPSESSIEAPSSVAPADSEPPTTEGGMPSTPTVVPMTATTPWTPPPPVDCGSFDLASGWPTTTAPSRSAAQCLQNGFDSGLPASLVVSQQTDGNGGAPVVTTYQVGPQGVLVVTIDATRAADRPQVVTTLRCSQLDASSWPPAFSVCVPWG